MNQTNKSATSTTQSVILTGAAGGIGMATLPKLVEAGYIVYAGAIDEWEISEINAIKKKLNTENIISVMLDVREPDQIEAVVSRIEKDHPRLATVIANGAACPVGAPFELLDFDSLSDVLNTNVVGNLRLLHRCLPMCKLNKSRIIIVSSMMGLIAGGMVTAYTSSKHATEAYADVLRRELAQFGIKIVLINPGAVKNTYMVAHHATYSKRWLAEVKGCDPSEISSLEFDCGKNTRLIQPNLRHDSFYIPPFQNYMELTRDALLPDKLTKIATADSCSVAIMKGIQVKSPRIRYIVGWDCGIMWALNWLLPKRVMDRIIRLGMFPEGQK